MGYQVSIPHRQSKNYQRRPSGEAREAVSIPHRQSKNAVADEARKLENQFQFLIGSLRTV